MAAGSTYRVTTLLANPYVERSEDGGFQGFMVDVLDGAAERAGFNYTMSVVEDGKYGFRDFSGHWTGMIRELVKRKADIALGDLSITTMRSKVVDFTKPILNQAQTLLVAKPKPAPPRHYSFLFDPLSLEVWILTLIAIVAVAILLMLISRFDPYEWRQVPEDKDPRRSRHSFGPRGSLMFVISTITLQGYREVPKSLAGRILAVTWFGFSFLIVITYISNLISFIMAGVGQSSGLYLPFQSLDDLVAHSYARVGVVKDGSTYHRIGTSKMATYEKLFYKMKREGSYVSSIQEGVERVKKLQGQFVMIVPTLAAEYITDRNCSLLAIGGSFLPDNGIGIATRVGLDLRDRLNLALLSMQEDGTIHMLKDRWWIKGYCIPPNLARPRKSQHFAMIIGVRHTSSIFLLLVIGAALSILVLVGEILFKRCKK